MARTTVLAVLALYFLAVSPLTCAATVGPAKRNVLKTLSGGFCRSWKFGVTISNSILYMVGLDGGWIPGDEDASNNYLVTLDLGSSFSVDDGNNYKLTLVDGALVPKIKNQALWSDSSNTTLFMYGGRYVSNTTANPTAYTYSIGNGKWTVQQGNILPNRLTSGAYTEARNIQAAYWVGGFQDSSTTLAITNNTQQTYATGMIQLNTTTQIFTPLDAPFTPVQEGALLYLPVGEMGILLFLGGDTPSVQASTNVKLSSNSWNTVQIYDIAAKKWYSQVTTGSVQSRTQFCATVHKDDATSSYAIYVLGGADLQSANVLTDVSYLTIPSFTWHSAGSLSEKRMSHACASYGSQIFGVGGRFEWTATGGTSCYNMPAFLYDTQSGTNNSNFDPTRASYSLPNAALQQVKESPYPASWADPALESLFVAKKTNSSDSPENSSSKPVSKKRGNTGTIAGAVVGGVVAVALVVGATLFFLRRRRKQLGILNTKKLGEQESSNIAEIQTFEPRTELDGHTPMVFELDGASGKK